MGTSLLLHALSLKDRILEPNQLPLAGHVWAFAKEACSREMFVGNSISMLSSLGIENVEVSWSDDIMAFDAVYREQPVTIIISLKDDSLASDYFYFMGIWSRPKAAKILGGDQFSGLEPWADEDLIKPDASFSVTVSDHPLMFPQVTELLGREVFGQRLYGDHFYIFGRTIIDDMQSGEFVICPASHGINHGRHEIRHVLYSLRNLMALMSRVVKLYERALADDVGMKLYQELMVLMNKADQPSVPVGEWDRMVCENGRISLQAASQQVHYRSVGNELHGIRRLFDAILSELNVAEMSGVASLFDRMAIPFVHSFDLLKDRVEMVARSERQAQILQQLLHSRMLAAQQGLLSELLQRLGP
ncbi:MAG TPA: hypothetical protein VNI58_10655 [Mariprofundaceae bacterium]|nr:hypothetical protein [Mariprofundaceae bacterium]